MASDEVKSAIDTEKVPCPESRCALPAGHDGFHCSGWYRDAFGFQVFDEWGNHPDAKSITKLVGEGRSGLVDDR